jgi:hypothetical protein
VASTVGVSVGVGVAVGGNWKKTILSNKVDLPFVLLIVTSPQRPLQLVVMGRDELAGIVLVTLGKVPPWSWVQVTVTEEEAALDVLIAWKRCRALSCGVDMVALVSPASANETALFVRFDRG